MVALVVVGSRPALAGQSLQQRKLEAGKSAIERLRHDERRRKYRDGWEAIERDLDGALRVAPKSALAPEVAWWAARSRVELYEASRTPADVRAAVASLRKVDEDYPDSPQGQRALILAVQIGVHAHERSETAATVRRLAARYGRSREARAALALVPRALPASASAHQGTSSGTSQKPVEIDEDDDSREPAPATAAAVTAPRASSPHAEPVDVPREAASVLRELLAEARGNAAEPKASPPESGSAGAGIVRPSAPDGDSPAPGDAADAPAGASALRAAPSLAPSSAAASSAAASIGSGSALSPSTRAASSGAASIAASPVSTAPASPASPSPSSAAVATAPRGAAPHVPAGATAPSSSGPADKPAAAASGSEDASDSPLPEPEAADAPPQRTPALLKLARDAVARLTEPEDVPEGAARARELRAAALAGGSSLAAQLGLKTRRVVIDPGHGGRDTGAIGPHGVREKDVALSIAKRLATRLRALNFAVTLTRKDDTFVALDERTRIANEAHADLFVSIHCNAARKRTLSGVETWTLNVASDRYAARLSAFENADDERTVSDLRLILADLATKANAGDARELAQSVQSSLLRNLRSRVGKVTDHGVKQALFYVLLGTHMPSILVETAFLSNPAEEARLRSSKYQDGAAEAIARGVKDFVDSRQRLAMAP